MRGSTRTATSALALLALAVGAGAEPPRGAVPQQALIVAVPSRFDAFIIRTGNVRVTFSDGRSELWTRSGDCHNAKVSPMGTVGWVRVDKKSIDADRMRITGKDSLVIRRRDGTGRELAPFDENVCIMEWAFADRDAAVVVRSMGHHGPSSYVKYELPSGRAVDSRGPGYTPYAELPAWAKLLADPNDS